MASRWWVIASISLSTLAVLACVSIVAADGYVRLFMDTAANQFIC